MRFVLSARHGDPDPDNDCQHTNDDRQYYPPHRKLHIERDQYHPCTGPAISVPYHPERPESRCGFACRGIRESWKEPNVAESKPPAGVTSSAARRFLEERFPDVARVEPIGHGAWSRAFAFHATGRDLVARFGAHGEDFAKDRFAARFASPALPVPDVIETGEALGRYYAVSERRFGGFIDELDGEELRALLPSLFATLDAMRAVDLSGASGWGMWDGSGNAPHASWRDALLRIAEPNDRLPGWRERLASSPTGLGPFEEAYARMEKLIRFAPPERHLIHSDLLHFNVLTRDGRITAVLDWGNALFGDFLYDLAWFVFWSPWFPAWHGIDFAAEALRHYDAIGLGVSHFQERLACCQLHIGLDSMAYCAFTGNLAQLDEVAHQTIAIARFGL